MERILLAVLLIGLIAFTAYAFAPAKITYGPADQWTAENRVLPKGEIGIETATGKFKIGDGNTPWTGLSYAVPVDSASSPTVAGITSTGTVTAALLSSSTFSLNHGACFKASGVLSYCTNSLTSTGTCSCN